MPGEIPNYIPNEFQKYITDLDLPGHTTRREELPHSSEPHQRLLRQLLDEEKARRSGRPVPARPAPLHKPVTPNDWQRSYQRGFAT